VARSRRVLGDGLPRSPNGDSASGVTGSRVHGSYAGPRRSAAILHSVDRAVGVTALSCGFWTFGAFHGDRSVNTGSEFQPLGILDKSASGQPSLGYRDFLNTEHSGPAGGPIQIAARPDFSQLSDDELRQLRAIAVKAIPGD
jgi:hypothetical protein